MTFLELATQHVKSVSDRSAFQAVSSSFQGDGIPSPVERS